MGAGQNNRSPATDAVVGAIAGIAATAVMTVSAASLYERLPRADRYPLPPRELTERVASTAGVGERLGEDELTAATLTAHFGFGAGVGALYALALRGRRVQPAVAGVGYGLAVWTASYLGWIPMLKLLRPATAHPPARNALMIAVHVLWGATLGLVADRLFRSLNPLGSGALRDR
ncbi:MAG: hypothetical protein GEU92_13650 [Alphaproteobacteria bacterium]|nr:hypothetical protein [Alphaproteobacteria bacterium]